MRGLCEELRKVWVDGTYRGEDWSQWVKEQYKIVLESVSSPAGQKGLWPYRSGGWWKELLSGWVNAGDWVKIMKHCLKQVKPLFILPWYAWCSNGWLRTFQTGSNGITAHFLTLSSPYFRKIRQVSPFFAAFRLNPFVFCPISALNTCIQCRLGLFAQPPETEQ